MEEVQSVADVKDEAGLAEKPALSALLGQIVDDTRSFARDEIAFLQAQAGERANYAMPGLIALGLAVALGLGAVIALLVGLTLWLASLINVGLAALIVTSTAIVLAALIGRWGSARLGRVFKPRDER